MQPSLYCNLNGKILLRQNSFLSSADDDFRLRYGVYETCLLRDGRIELELHHWERLLAGLKQLGFIVLPEYTQAFFREQLLLTAGANARMTLCRLRLQFFSDSSTPPFYPQYLVESFDIATAVTQWLPGGIKAAVLDNFTKRIDKTSNYKISHNQHFLAARTAMAEYEADDVLLLNEAGNIIESGIGNIFWIKNEKVFTPPLSEGCVSGTMRRFFINRLLSHPVFFKEQPMSRDDLQTADEVFITNAIRKMRWIKQVENHHYGSTFSKMLYDLVYTTL